MFETKFWDHIAGGVAQKWVERLFSPGLVFWAGGILTYVTVYGWEPLIAIFQPLQTPLQIAVAVGGLIVGFAGSVAVVESLQKYALRLLEGYWPHWLHPLRRSLVERICKRNRIRHTEWSKLGSHLSQLTPEELTTYADLDAVLAQYPKEERLLPTRLGNRLRAAEDYGWRRYGLAIAVVWPRLWGVLPERAQKEITDARERLDAAVRFILWSILFLSWSGWAWSWVIPLAVLGMLWGYWQAIEAAGVYGELLRATIDIHRVSLYRALNWPLPRNPADEHVSGRQLSLYLWRGSDDTAPLFVHEN